MESTCHLCGSTVVTNGDHTGEVNDGFECADCGKLTCTGCKSIGVGRKTEHCKRCRG